MALNSSVARRRSDRVVLHNQYSLNLNIQLACPDCFDNAANGFRQIIPIIDLNCVIPGSSYIILLPYHTL